MRPRGHPRALEQRRLKAIKLLNEGLGPGDIARRLCVNRRSVHRWLAAYRDRGIAGVAPLPVPGRPCKLSTDDRERFSCMLVDDPATFGYLTHLWTNREVVDLIRRRFGVAYHVNHIGRFLQKLRTIIVSIDESGLRRFRKKA